MVQEVLSKHLSSTTFAAWVSEVRKASLVISWPGISIEDRLTFRGDALELLTEFLVKSGQLNTKTGLQDYKCVPLKYDYGVDATGINVNGDFTVVQCKFRRNPLDLIHYSDLARTLTQGVLGFGLSGKLDVEKKKNIWLVTSAMDANHNAQTILGKSLHVIGYNHLSKTLDGNKAFWTNFYNNI